MSGLPPWRILLPRDREAWRQTRNARRTVLDKVRARRAAAWRTPKTTGKGGRS